MLAVSHPRNPTGTIAAPARARRVAIDPLALGAAMVVAVGIALRVTTGRDLPLWLDETFTGAIAAQPSLAAVGRQILADVNAPLYYLIAHAWSLVFGLSNASLRFPAFAFSAAAPLLCLVPTPAIARRVRLVWCMLVALWGPGLAYAQEARCYSLVFCLGVVLTTAFAALLHAPSRRRATIWALVGTLAVLAHYHALVLVALQGAAFLAIHRRRAVAAWPAALVFLPLAAWLVVASDRIRAFNAAGVAWYGRMRVDELFDVLRFTTGLDLVAALGLVLAVAALVALAWTRRSPSKAPRLDAAVIAAATAFACLCLVVALAFVRPSFTMRYLMAFEPGLLLGLALAAERARAFFRPASAILVVLMAEGAFAAPVAAPPKYINFEIASDALIADGTKTLAFFWDNPDNAVEAPAQLAAVGGFFFHRRGVAVDVRPLVDPRGSDPNPRLLALAQGPDARILWVYDRHIHDTAAKAFPPRIAQAPGWSCENFGTGAIGILACHRRPS